MICAQFYTLTLYSKTLKNVELKDLSPKNVASFPCARNSLLLGIASGVTAGLLRLYRSRGFIRTAGNWGFGTFAVVSISSWELCRLQRRKSQEALQLFDIGPSQHQPKFEYDDSASA